jgi:hypothetical protein
MKNFACTHCGSRVYFENVSCLVCAHRLGFDAATLTMATLVGPGSADGSFRRVVGTGRGRGRVRYCANAAQGVCNWLTPADDATGLCKACKLNRTIPNLAEPGNLKAWAELERAKKRLIYSLLRFGLPYEGAPPAVRPMTFDFVRDASTGHLDGVITIDVMEADAVERERQRQHFQESYRSLLGHLRHESGHYFWTILIDAEGRHEGFRVLFGDERQDYPAALARHHAEGPPADWQESHVSAYASSHPWEDWAETWAHYLHMVATLDAAEAQGMEPRAAGLTLGAIWPFRSYDLYREESFQTLMDRWVPLTLAMNSLSRSMGHDDFYPFVIPAPAYAKLAFVHDLIRQGSRLSPDGQARRRLGQIMATRSD